MLDPERRKVIEIAVNNIVARVADEAMRQFDRWDIKLHPPDRWVAIVTEEVGEAARAAITDDLDGFQKEIIQTAAACVCAFFESSLYDGVTLVKKSDIP